MDVFKWNRPELGAPLFDELSAKIVFDWFFQCIQIAYAGWANTCSEVPIGEVRLHLVIDQFLLEMVRSVAPVLLQVQR